MKEDPPPDTKCRDKFLVQSVLVTADKEFTNVGSLVSEAVGRRGMELIECTVATYRADLQVVHSGEED
jgi:hypothetical protein